MSDGAAAPAGSIGVRPESVGELGTYAKGAKLTDSDDRRWINARFDRGGWDGGAQVGLGTSANGTGFSWHTLDYYGEETVNGVVEKKVHANLENFQFTQTGRYNLIYQARTSTSVDWVNQSGTPTERFGYSTAYPPSDFGATYFTVVDVPNPTSCSAEGASGGVQLAWSRATTTHDSSAKYNVMVVRYAKGASVTAPTDGTPYAANATIGAGTVVYASWSGDGFKDESATACTDYDYYIYSENYNYYSSGVKVEGKYCAPSFGSSDSIARATTVGTAITAVDVPSAGGSPTATYSISPNNVSGASFNTSTRQFTFTPNAVGTYVFTVTADNVVGSDTYTITVTVTPKPPTKGTVSYPSDEAEGRVVIPWTKNTALNDVMVVRVSNNGTAPSPVNGTSYSTGAGLGGQIVYKGNATSYKDTGLTAGTDYDYYLFSVSGNYYSTGVKVDAKASKAPRFSTLNVSKSTTVGGTASNTQTASGTPSTMTYSVTCTAGGATTGFSVNGSGVFSFAPTAAGTYVFTVSAANGVTAVSASSYTITVTVTAAAPTVGSPSRTGTTAVGATLGGTVSSTGGATVTEWGVVYSATSVNADPTVGGTGCTTVTASGTPGESAFTAAVTGLKANTEYKWKAYAVNSVGTGYTAVQTFTTPCMSEGPVVTPEGINGGARFTWTEVGAVEYLLSLWTGSGSGEATMTHTFPTSGGAASDGESVTDTTPDPDVTVGTLSFDNGSASSSPGYFAGGLRLYNSTGANKGGSVTLTLATGVSLKKVVVTSSQTQPLEYIVDGESAVDGTWNSGTMTITLSTAATTSFTLHNVANLSSGHIRIGSLELTYEKGSKTYVTGGTGGTAGTVGVLINELAVSSGVEVMGLTVAPSPVTYNWSLKAVGGGTGCEEDGTPYGTNTYVVTPTTVTPTLTVSPSSLDLGSTTYGTAGSPQSFTVEGADLSTDVMVTPPAGVSVCLTSGGTYQTTALTVTEASAEAPGGATVYVKLTGASVVASLSDNVSVESTGAATVNVAVSGTVTAVAPTVGNPTSGSVGTTGATLGGTVTANGGAALTGGGVRYRVNGSGAAWTTVAAGSTPTLNTAFTVLVTGLTPGTTYEFQAYAGNGTQTGYTASGVTFTTLRPTLTVSPLTVSDMAGVQYQDGTPVNVSVSGANMMGNVTVAVTSGFEVSTDDGASWGSEKYISVAGATLTATTVKVRIASGSGTGPVTGTLTVSSSNAADVTVSLSGSVTGATVDTGYWLGNSYLILNGNWYNGTGTGNNTLPASGLGCLTTLTLGAQVQTAGQNDGETYPAYMTYSIDSGAETTVALVWFKYNNENLHNYFGMGGDAGQGQHVQTATTLDLSGLSGGEHTLHVYFSQPTSVGSGTLYDNSSTKVTYNVTFVVPAWNGPNTVYWREEAVDGHFVRQDDDGNHDPWWYQITPTVGFHNPNMTDYGPNCVIINNNNQRMMTNDVASTVESFSFTPPEGTAGLARTNWGSATLTVNSAITNTAAQLVFKVPVALGGNVKVHATNATYFSGGLSGSGKTLTKTGGGTMYISSAATLGALAVNTGHVQLNSGGSLDGNVTVSSSRSLRTNPGSGKTVNYGGVLSGAGYFLKQGAGTTTLSGANTYSGKTSVTNGTLIASNATALGSGAVYVGGASAKLQIAVASVSVKSVTFSGSSSALVTGTGKVLASTGNAIIQNVTFDAGNYSGEDTQWTIVTSSTGTITLNGTLTVVNPPATGRCELELAADNKTLYVTYYKPPTAPSLTVATVAGNGGQLSVTATPPAGAGVVVVRNESGTFGSPTGTTLPSVGATEWAGGTVVDVTGGTFTDSGLTGCTTYYYKAWSLKNGLWSTTGTAGSAATDTPAAPVLNAIADATVTYQGFTVTWNAVPGAATYRMDIVQGSAETTAASYDFNENTTGWTLASSERDSNALKIGSGSYGGSADSPTINLSGNGGNATLAFDAWSYGSDTDCILDVWYKASSSDTDWVHVTDTISISSTSTPYSFSLTGGTSTSQISFTTDTKKKRVYVDNIVITQGGTSPVAGWTDKDVGSLMTESAGVVSVAVTGLDEMTAYSVTVRSEGATPVCKSGDSNTESATTKENTSVTSVTISDADGDGGTTAVPAGAVAAGETVLLQGSKLLVAAGSVDPVLTGVTFGMTGTATGGDIGTLRVRVGTSSTYAGDETVLGTATYTGAGTYTVSGSQTLAADATYYVWIEADTLATATGGSTVTVPAMAKEAFAITNGRKSGSTTAAGTQKIGNLSSLSVAAVTDRADQGSVMSVTFGRSLDASESGVLIRWSDVSYADIPDPDAAWAGKETWVAVSGTSPAEVSGLTACKTYFFKAWEVVGGAAGTAQQATGAVNGPAAPTGLNDGTPGARSATLTWNAVAGATGYSLDVWHYVGGSGTVTKTDEFTIGLVTEITGNNSYTSFTGKQCPEGSDAVYAGNMAQDSGSYIQMNTGRTPASGLWTTTSGGTVKSVTVDWHNASGHGYAVWGKTSGTFTGADTTGAESIGTLDSSTLTTGDISASGYVAVLILPSGGASYADSITIEWESGGGGVKTDDVVANAPQTVSGQLRTLTWNSATSATVGNLGEATRYYWKVAATGTECTGTATSDGDGFETTELLGAPTVEAYTGPGSGQVTGTVSRASGATVTLKRYPSEADALADTNGHVVPTTATETATLVKFDDTGIEGCQTHWYRAWQSGEVEEGVSSTSPGSTPVSATATLGAPVMDPYPPVGAGTSLPLSWQPVAGASYYTVLVSDTENMWTHGSSGTAVLDEDFAGFTGNKDVAIDNSLDSYTGGAGWYGKKVYPMEGGGAAKLGSSSAKGLITTPGIEGGLPTGGKVHFDVKRYDTDNGKLDVQICYDDGDDDDDNDEWTVLKEVTPSDDWQSYSVDISAGSTTFWICFETTAKRAFLDNVRIVLNGGGSGGTIKYEATVSAPPYGRTADGLEVGRTYWYMVTAWSDGGCTNAVSGPANTEDVPLIQARPKEFDFGRVDKNTAVTHDFTIKNTGSEDLSISAISIDPDPGVTAYTITAIGDRTELSTTSDTNDSAGWTLAPNASLTVTVQFRPWRDGGRGARLRIRSNAYNANGGDTDPTVFGNWDVALTGDCHDPSTEPPTVFLVDVEDGLGIEDTITDHSLALGTADGTGGELAGAKRPELKVLMWHYNGMWTNLTGEKSATWTLKDPTGTEVWSGQSFTGVTARTYGGKTNCLEFTAAIPTVGAEGAIRGTYTVEVTGWDRTKEHGVATNMYAPAEKGWLLDDFTRADRKGDGLGALEDGWTAQATDSTPGTAAIHAHALEMWGPHGDRSGAAGRIAAVRDMSDWGYEKNPEDMASTVSWGFHFRMGGEPVGFDDGSTAGAFVLGAAGSDFFSASTSQKGYAVTMTGAGIELVRFSKGWIASGTRTVLVPRTQDGTGAWVEDGTKPHGWTGSFAGKTLAVRVDFLPGQEYIEDVQEAIPARMKLYVREVGGTGGNPLEECADATPAATVHLAGDDLLAEALPYAGPVWNHGNDTTSGSEKKWGLFDDFHFPCQKDQEIGAVVHVIDEDTEAPELDDFTIGGAVAGAAAAGSGLAFTGRVRDASGIWAAGSAKAPTWTLYVDENNDGVLGVAKASGPLAVTLLDGTTTAGSGAAEEVLVGATIPGASFNASWRSTNCVVAISVWDHDRDRSGDSLEGTGEYRFTLCDEAPVAPAWATVEADGAELAVLRWARPAGGGNFVVVRSGTEFGDDLTPPQQTMTEPVTGTVYEGLGTVVYAGAGTVTYRTPETDSTPTTAAWCGTEVPVSPGSSNYFAVYGVTGNGTTGYFFSNARIPTDWSWIEDVEGTETAKWATHDGTASGDGAYPDEPSSAVRSNSWPMVSAAYEPGEGVDSFEYLTAVTDPRDKNPQEKASPFGSSRAATGSGWGGPWTEHASYPGRWSVHDGSLLTGDAHYPAGAGNKLYWRDTSSTYQDKAILTRPLSGRASGDFFVAAVIHFQFHGRDKYANIALMDGETELASFGKQGDGQGNDGDDWSRCAALSLNSTYRKSGTGTATVKGADAYDMGVADGQDHIIVGQVSPSEKKVRLWAYGPSRPGVRIAELFRSDDPDAPATAMGQLVAELDMNDTAWPGVTAIRLQAGSPADAELGHVYFDEVRFAGTWEELFLFNAPEVYTYEFDQPMAGSGIMVGTDEDGHRLWKISDGALAHGDVGLNAQFGLYHRTGIQSASFAIKDEEGNSLLRPAEWRATTTNALTGAVTTNDTRAGTGGAAVSVALDGTRNTAYPTWWTTNAAGAVGGAVGVAVPTNWISTNETYTVEVTVKSTGGKEASVTSASETGGGGADDLFIGEYGEGSYWDKYIELYNGTGHDIDLYNYYIFRPKKEQDWSDYSSLIPDGAHPYVRLALTEGTNILHHKETIVLLNRDNPKQSDSYKCITTNKTTGAVTTNTVSFTAADRLNAMISGLESAGAKYQVMPDEVLNAGGDVPYLLIAASNFNESDVDAKKGSSAVSLDWLDACGLASLVFEPGRSSERYIMSRKDTAQHLPRSKPLTIDPTEWDYRDWGWPKSNWRYDDYSADRDDNAVVDPSRSKYTNFVATAGQYDRNIGLGGDMEFQVFDDDEVAPVLGATGSGLYLTETAGVPELLATVAGSRDFVLAGWSFTNNTAGVAEAMEVWIGSAEKENARLTCSENLGTVERLVVTGSGKGVTGATFNGVEQIGNGELYFKCNAEGYNITGTDEAWIGFETDMESMTEREVSFWYATGPDGFKAGKVQVSTDGVSWEDVWELALDPTSGTGSADTFVEFVQSLEYLKDGVPAIPRGIGHLWFRVVVSERSAAAGSFRMDCIQVRGTPDEVSVSDEALVDARPTFLARVSDPGSGLDAETAEFRSGLEGISGSGAAHSGSSSLVDGGKDPASALTWQIDEALTTDNVQKWFEASEEGKTHLKITVADADDDRADDQTTLNGDFGVLRVYDDDEDPPEIKMTSMKPRVGNTLAEWCFADKAEATSAAATKHANGLNASVLKARAGGGTEPPKPLYPSAYDSGDATKGWGEYQKGWHFGTKYWYVRLKTLVGTTGDDGAIFKISRISFDSKVGSLLSPTSCSVSLVSGITEASIDPESDAPADGTVTPLGTISLLPEGAAAWTSDTIKHWKDGCSLAVDVTLAGNSLNELRLLGTGCTDPSHGISATWYIHNLAIEGSVTYSDGRTEDVTYVTDHALASGETLGDLTGNAWDEKSGIASATYTLRRPGTTPVSGSLLFTAGSGTQSKRMAAAKSEAAGAFAVDLSGIATGYSSVHLGDYTGSVEVWDDDKDRTVTPTAGASGSGRRDGSVTENVDRLKIDGDFGFTVVDQDVKSPTAPGSVAVNGVSMASVSEPQWTNTPEFTVTFSVAHDKAPESEEMAANGWIPGVQDGVTGVGEYRVALTDTEGGRASASAFTVAVTNGAIGNYGFEDATAGAWSLTGGAASRIAGESGAPSPAEGLKSLYVPGGTVGSASDQTPQYPQSQVMVFANSGESPAAPKIGGSIRYYLPEAANNAGPSPRVLFEAFTDASMSTRVAAAYRTFRARSTPVSAEQAGWHECTFDFDAAAAATGAFAGGALGDGTVNCIKVSLYSQTVGAYFDDVRLGVKVGAGTVASMRYVATLEAQGLQNKFLYAVDADNDRAGDRLEGPAAAFHTAYDVTPPTAVKFHLTTASGDHGHGALTSDDDPTTQFDLVWDTKSGANVLVGPDDPYETSGAYGAIADAIKSAAAQNNALLSPWGSYKVYYRTYDPVAIETAAAAAPPGTTVADYLYKTLVQDESTGTAFYKDASKGWKWIQNGDKIADPSANASGILSYTGLDKVLKPGAAAGVTTNGMRLYDLEFDQEYLVVIAGVDAAGNEGPVTATSWATNNTIRFALIKGWHETRTNAVSKLQGMVENIGDRLTNTTVQALQWIAAGSHTNAQGVYEGDVSKDYDLIHWDARSFRESPDNDWKLLQTVKTNWFVDDGGPTNRGSIRFYRASYKNRWRKAVTNATTGQVTAQTPLVSEEVYAQTAVRLRSSTKHDNTTWNFVALHGVPYTNTFRAVFGGTETFPAGASVDEATSIHFYTPGPNAISTNTYWLKSEDGEWHDLENGDAKVSDVFQKDRNFFTRAFSIHLPDGFDTKEFGGEPNYYRAGTEMVRHSDGTTTPVPYLLWKPIVQVPTNGFSQEIHCGDLNQEVFNIVALRLPVAAHPSEMNLRECGFGCVTNSQTFRGDLIYTIDTVTREPGNSCYCKKVGENQYEWRFVRGNGLVPAGYFKPNDVLVIVSKNGGVGNTWTWTYDPKKFYTLPNRHMQAGE